MSKSKHPKKISEETIHENPWWKYKHDELELPDGADGDYYYGKTNDSIVVVPVLPNGKLGLILQYRYLSEKESIEFPSGQVLKDKSAEESAEIELLEETGYVADDFVRIATFEPFPGVVKEKAHLFLVKVVDQKEQQLEATEQIELMQRRPDEFQDMVARGDIFQGMTLAAWSLVKPYLFKKESGSKGESPRIQKVIDKFDQFLGG